ncbi:MAG: SNF2-related protein [Prevotellaceae bacterium]|nr:SNF2-related protein [Prevotellaceae bacterium]
MQTGLPKLINNITERMGDDLRQRLTPRSRLSIAAASFSIYAYEALKREMESVWELRFIFTSPTFVKDTVKKERREYYIPKLNRERSLYGTDFEIRLRNQLSQKAIAKECAEWIRKKVRFKSNSSQGNMQSFLHISDETSVVYQPFDEFTTTQIGCERGNSLYTLINVSSSPNAEAYLSVFDELWNNADKLADVTEKVLEYIETVYQENAPEYIYFITLYNIFREFLEDISEDTLPNERTGFKDSLIWKKLYNFQRDAALSIINKLEKYNGCILADSVGLGKTFTALAVIKYYENRNKSVLVLCPKKLCDNWMTFRSNYKDNPIAADRLRYDVLFHSDLSRDSGTSNGMDLEHINWGNYDLVVIDESHNFRNGGNVDDDEEEQLETQRENRYQRLMERVIRAGVQTKVLMLSATPVNNRFNDLKNQLQLAYEGRAANINPALGLGRGIDDIFRNAQKVYNKWSKLEPADRTTQRLLDDLSFDFFQLLDAVTIARSRSHITKYYDMSDIGEFPARLSPISRRPRLTDLHSAITFTDISRELNHLSLAIYTPSLYIYDSAKDNYGIDTDVAGLSIDGREKGLRQLMATNLLKRLESSVYSFRLTLSRIKSYIESTLQTIEKYEREHSAEVYSVAECSMDMDSTDSENNPFATKKTQIRVSDIDTTRWRIDLQRDLETFDLLLLMLQDITPEHDTKLQTLIADLKHKFASPINEGNKKVLIFTAFTDTATYIYNQLAEKIKQKTGLNVALITGDTEGKCTIEKMKLSFNNILTHFSPVSKNRAALFPDAKEEIDVLIATDCISEGQNLQDCDYLINYDIHWNPVRIIQRFGRIDRIGSRNKQIQLVNYWPDIELDEYIKLKGRVESRMKAAVLTASGDDNPLTENEKGDLEYRRKQLERLQNEVVDIEDMDTGINIMDLGLNEFRLDLLSYVKDNPDVEHAPFGMNAVVAQSEVAPSGVVFVLKNRNDGVNIDRKNLLHPFYMVYVADDGEIVCDHLHPKRLLDTLRHTCKGKSSPDRKLCALLNKQTADGKKMEHYSDLLQAAVQSIVSVKQESDIDSLFSEGETTALLGEVKGLDDFELISFLIIK